ncbi:unnamed protein product, partial [Ectocarpus sp. 6 AP-2014]
MPTAVSISSTTGSRAGAARGGAAVAASPIAPSRGRHLKPTNIVTLAQVSQEQRLIKPLSTSVLLPNCSSCVLVLAAGEKMKKQSQQHSLTYTACIYSRWEEGGDDQAFLPYGTHPHYAPYLHAAADKPSKANSFHSFRTKSGSSPPARIRTKATAAKLTRQALNEHFFLRDCNVQQQQNKHRQADRPAPRLS